MACLFHKWDGCKCAKCGKVRDKSHNWNECECKRCGKLRNQGHIWNGCDCTVCGKFRLITDSNEVEKITEQAMLTEIINIIGHSDEVKKAAKSRLIDLQTIEILEIADHIKLIAAIKKEGNSEVGLSVIEKLTDQAVLADIAGNSSSNLARLKAAERLEDKTLSQNMLAKIVKDEKVDKTLRESAYKKITNQTVLQDISNEPFVKELMSEKAHIANLAKIKKEKRKRIENCKNHEWESHNAGHYQGRVCKKCGASEITEHY